MLIREVFDMATKSILKNIVIKDKKSCSSLINALEGAKGKIAKEVNFSRSVRTIKKMFGDKKE